MQCHRFVLIPLLVLWAQSQPEEPHAVVNGKQVSLSDVQGLMDDKMPPDMRNPDGLFHYYGFIDKLAAKAEAAKLAEKSPYKEQLELARKQILAIAELNEVCNNTPIPDADVEAYFTKHKADYAMAKVQALLIPQKGSTEEALAKAREL